MKLRNIKIIAIIILLITCSGLIYFYKITKKEKVFDSQVNLSYEYQVQTPGTVYNSMTQLQNEGKISFKEKDYPGMGKFVEEINGIKNSGKKNWIYYVNGKKANIGVSNYKINNGDMVSWKYENNY